MPPDPMISLYIVISSAAGFSVNILADRSKIRLLLLAANIPGLIGYQDR